MGRTNSAPTLETGNTVDNANYGFRSIRDRIRFKRNPNLDSNHDRAHPDRHLNRTGRSHLTRSSRKSFRGSSLFYLLIMSVVFAFAMASMVLQSSIGSVFGGGGSDGGRSLKDGLKFGDSLKFKPPISVEEELRDGIDLLRREKRIAVRPPRLCFVSIAFKLLMLWIILNKMVPGLFEKNSSVLENAKKYIYDANVLELNLQGKVIGNMKKDPHSLMLFTVVKNLQSLGYFLKIYAIEDGNARSLWEKVGGQILVLSPEGYGHVDWSSFEGIVMDSLETRQVISRLMQDPFSSVPLIWIVQEDTLAKRLPMYKEMHLEHLISYWKNAFKRATFVVFPDYSLPLLYSVLDAGNFIVIPGSPKDVWAAESYSRTHSKYELRKENGFRRDDILVIVVGSNFFYSELSWDYAVAMHAIGPLLSKYARRKDTGESIKFIFLCGNSTDENDAALQEVASRLGLVQGSVRHYGMNDDVSGVLMMADIVLYGSSQDEQGFPPLLIRAMSFGIPVISPDSPVIKKYVSEGPHAIIYPKQEPDALLRAFSLLISNGKLSEFAHMVASSGRLLARNMLASGCIDGYAKLLERVLDFPSDVQLPGSIAGHQRSAWEWNLFEKEIKHKKGDDPDIMRKYGRKPSLVYSVEEEMIDLIDLRNISDNATAGLAEDIPNKLDWDILREMETSEDLERREFEELEDRTQRDLGNWEDIYRSARKVEKIKFEANERDEGELERTGQPVCIYEIYDGAGAWPFLHHGSLYRGLTRRSRSDDVDAVGRLPFLNETYYRDILCEIGGMFSIAYKVDDIHKRPWIGFQSWRAAGKQVSLSGKAEKVLEKVVQEKGKGDVIYFWARMEINGALETDNVLTFWSMCDIFNGGHCRDAFEDAFRQMYALPSKIEALPPMPEEGGHWSALHSWVMPTPSFLEFVMFSRMFADSLDGLHANSNSTTSCLLSSSELERRHCYCRILEFLVNVWAYHSARKMVYIDPHTGVIEEQHPIEQRMGFLWAKYFNFTLLKSMDEDMAEAADDGDHPRAMWLWPLTGEVHWQGIYEREREERYRLKMDKKRKTKEKLFERMKFGYKQKTLGR
ncbi:Glycosyl transferase, family 1 [Dillenia turbinata]|uniref:Glycosyl transferase, family 1 n=1 Tax=Dillenia turbinata TaxID=194707 RepID=A0AAN8Z769_9MAGN